MRYCTLLMIGAMAPAWAQAGREGYRVPYQTWRQTAPALEQDAATPGPVFAAQVQASTQAMQGFMKAREAYITAPQPGAAEQAKWVGQPLTRAEALLNTPPEMQQLLAVAGAKVATSINSYPAADKDPAIRQLRQALERERAALRALTETMAAHKTSVTELIDLTDQAEVERGPVSQAYASATGRRTQLAAHIQRETADWTEYYKHLAEGSVSGGRTTGTVAAAPITVAAGAPNPPAPAKVTRPTANGQIPLSRYTGEWVFPTKGLFYGPQPETVELVVKENSGRIAGTLTARFAAQAGSRENPTLTLEFQGPVLQGKTQKFPLQTNDGATGTIELIPGSAFNLLEVNVQAEARPNKIGSTNFVLVKR